MALAAVCFAGFLLMVLAQVFYRYFGVSMVFSEDAARLFNIYAVFLGLVMIVHAEGDVRIDLIDRFFLIGKRSRAVAGLAYGIVMLTLLAAIATGAFLLMRSNWGLSLPAMTILHQGHIYLAPFLGSLLSILVLVEKMRQHLLVCAGLDAADTTQRDYE